MLRQMASSAMGRRLSGARSCRYGSAAPSVFDKIVQLTVVDKEGHRHVLRGLEGQTVADVLQGHTDILGEDVLALSPSVPDQLEAHIKIPTELFDTFPAPSDEVARQLTQVAAPASIDIHSRLASNITLSCKTGDILVSLGDLAPWKTL
ncbi:NUOP3 [Auxenochlorella protothecoides x Auxenochlorella symbiontica]